MLYISHICETFFKLIYLWKIGIKGGGGGGAGVIFPILTDFYNLFWGDSFKLTYCASLPPWQKEVMILVVMVCLTVCLSVNLQATFLKMS